MYILESHIGRTFALIDRSKHFENLKKFDFNGQKVLDLGCGAYEDVSFLFLKNPEMTYLGIDHDQSKIDTFPTDLGDNIKVECRSFHEMDYEKEISKFDVILLLHPDNFFPITTLTSFNRKTLINTLYRFVNDGKRVLVYPSSIAPLYYKENGEKIYWYVPYDKICEIMELCFSNLFTVRMVNDLVELTKSENKMEFKLNE